MKRILSVLIVLVLMFSLLPFSALAADAEPMEEEIIGEPTEEPIEPAMDGATITASGTCGANLTWTLDEDGLLTIAGVGEMEAVRDYSLLYYYTSVPWYPYRKSIKSVIIGKSVTSIGDYAFFRCNNLTSITIPEGVTIIGGYAFEECTGLKSVLIPDSVWLIGCDAFAYCTALTSVTIGFGVTSISDGAFSGCSALTAVNYTGDLVGWCSIAFTSPASNPLYYAHHLYIEGDNQNTHFTLGIDNNNFRHTTKAVEAAGFVGVSSYALSNYYYQKLTANSSDSEKDLIKKEMAKPWGGSCYGIATSIGLLYEGYMDLSDLTTSSTATSYFTMPYPYQDAKLLNVITYYQLSQFLENGGKKDAARMITYGGVCSGLKNWINGGTGLSDFLKKLVQYAAKGQITLFGFSTAKSGHAVLLTGCEYDTENKQYRVEIYDENSVDSQTSIGGSFLYMTVADDYSSFSFTSANGKLLNQQNFYDMFFLDWNELGDVILDGAVQESDHATIMLPLGEEFTIINAAGEYIQYKDSQYSGDMNIYDINTIEDGENSRIVFEVDDTASVTLTDTQGTMDVDFYNDEDFLSLAGEGVESAVLTLAEGIELEGTDYSFKAYVGMDAISEDENGLLSVTATAGGETSLTRTEDNTLSVESEAGMTDIETAEYVGVNKAVQKHEDAESLVVEVRGETYIPGDVDGSGAVNILDVLHLLKYVAGQSVEISCNSDVDGSGKTNILDVLHLLKYVAGQDVTLN